jgi:hypothetical protein
MIGWGTWIRTKINGVRGPAGEMIYKCFFSKYGEMAP